MSPASAKLAVYLSSHGFGHTVRTGAVCAALAERMAVRFTVVSPAAPHRWPHSLAADTCWRTSATDAGVVQSNGIDVDFDASAQAVTAWQNGFEQTVERESSWLRGRAFDLVLGDVPAAAFAAAARAGLPSVALANFSWDWIYRRLGFEQAADTAARAYGHADLLLALEPGPPMGAFGRRRSLGLLGRRSRVDRHRLRSRLGVQPQQRLALLAMPAIDGADPPLPEPGYDVLYLDGSAAPRARADVVPLPAGFPFVDAVAAADVVVAKPGYGIIGDAAANGSSLLWTRRQGFPEDPLLETWIRDHLVSAEVERERIVRGSWLEDLESLFALQRADPHPAPALTAARDELVRLLEGGGERGGA